MTRSEPDEEAILPGEDIAAWDAEAAAFDEPADHGLLDSRVREAWRQLLVARLPAAPAIIVDLGCGTGSLTILLGHEGYQVDGVDFSPKMLERAKDKAGAAANIRFLRGDAYKPALPSGTYDVVLCRHVLWAMPDPAVALARWQDLLVPGGILLLVEGRWSNGVGLTADETIALIESTGRHAELTILADAVYWGRVIDDTRYIAVSRARDHAESAPG